MSEHSMEQEQHQWTLHEHEHEEEEEEEEEEDSVLERRKFLQQNNGGLISGVVVSSSSSSSSSSFSNGSNGLEHSNGVDSVVKVNDPDGSIVQKEEEHAEIESFGENGNHFDNEKEDCEVVGLGVIEAETNGEGETGSVLSDVESEKKNSVYFDKQQGIWKCHHCTWTKQFDGPWTVPFKTMIQHAPCFVCETRGSEVNGANGVQNGDSAGSVLPTNLVERELDVKVQDAVMKAVNDKIPSSSEISCLHDSSDIQATPVMISDNGTSAKEGPNIIKEKEYDVETVLAKQETHDLICPNCNSCITKRVILKKRKRTSHNVDDRSKPDKLVATDKSNVVGSSVLQANEGDSANVDHMNVMPDNVSLEQPDDNNDPERGQEVFRCLSCLSFFIPTGNCFNLFRNNGGARQRETLQNSSSTPASNLQNPSNVQGSNANWLFSLFKGKTAREQGDACREHSRTDPSEQNHSTTVTSNMTTSPKTGHREYPTIADTSLTVTVENEKPLYTTHGQGGLNSMNSSTTESVKTELRIENDIQSKNDLSSIQASTNGADDVKAIEQEKKIDSADISKTNNMKGAYSTSFSNKHENTPLSTAATTETLFNARESANGSILNPYEQKPEFPVPTMPESSILDKSHETIQKSYSSLKQGTQSLAHSFGNGVLPSDVASNKPSSLIDVIIPSETLIQKDKKDIEEEINPSDGKENEGGDVIVSIEEEVDTTSHIAHNVQDEGDVIAHSRTQTNIGEQPTPEAGESKEWEILKSIVYGGLVESITSLGIVASAASSGTAPLNIVVLGLANLIGGLFILAHNLSDLRNDHSGGDQRQTNDRYQEQLGHRSNFVLHAVVAVLSFLIFGSVPIVVYGILINKNYYAEVKLATIAATSIICIIVLAIGKVYTTRPPKSYIKTVLYYVTLALAASGVSYIGGNLIKDLLENFNQSDSGFAITMPISDTKMEPAWTSY